MESYEKQKIVINMLVSVQQHCWPQRHWKKW